MLTSYHQLLLLNVLSTLPHLSKINVATQLGMGSQHLLIMKNLNNIIFMTRSFYYQWSRLDKLCTPLMCSNIIHLLVHNMEAPILKGFHNHKYLHTPMLTSGDTWVMHLID